VYLGRRSKSTGFSELFRDGPSSLPSRDAAAA
jgi:hypothetical protein